MTSHGQPCLSRHTKWKQQWAASQIQPDQAKARQPYLPMASQPAMASQPMPTSHGQPARSSHGQIQPWSASHDQLTRSSHMTGQPRSRNTAWSNQVHPGPAIYSLVQPGVAISSVVQPSPAIVIHYQQMASQMVSARSSQDQPWAAMVQLWLVMHSLRTARS